MDPVKIVDRPGYHEEGIVSLLRAFCNDMKTLEYALLHESELEIHLIFN